MMRSWTTTGLAVWVPSVKKAVCTGKVPSLPGTTEVSVSKPLPHRCLAGSLIDFCDSPPSAGFHGKSAQTGTLTPKTLNSLSAITGHEGDEEDWEREMRGFRNEEVSIVPKWVTLSVTNLPHRHIITTGELMIAAAACSPS